MTVSYDVTDNCPVPSGSCTLSVTSNEPVLGHGSGNTSPDWIVVDDHHVLLRAEREGGGNGRIYTLLSPARTAAVTPRRSRWR